jgi:hypothetical protein
MKTTMFGRSGAGFSARAGWDMATHAVNSVRMGRRIFIP